MGDTKPDCKYGAECYQKNPAHQTKFNHPKKGAREEPEGAGDSKRKGQSPLNFEKDLKRPKPSARPLKEVEDEESSESVEPKSESEDSVSSKREGTLDSQSSISQECKKDDKQDKKDPKSDDDDEAKPPRQRFDISKEYKEVMENASRVNYLEIFQRRVRYSQEAEYQDLLKSTEFIRHHFLVEMPEDFYQFWDFCKHSVKVDQKPEKVFEKVGLKLVGPFDYLAGKFHEAKIYEPGDYLCHWRFYYDPPEMQTIFALTGTEVHYGFWRDDPKDKEKILIARNDSKKDCEFEFVAGNCFEALQYFLEKDVIATPFNRAEINNLKKSLRSYMEKDDLHLSNLETIKKARENKVVCKTFHRAGLVVPFNRKTQVGYRTLIESDAKLRTILSMFENVKDKSQIGSAMEALQPIITAANIAVDECDFGTIVELGIDMFCSGHQILHELITQLLASGYSLLQRPQFIAVIKSHLGNRRKGNNLSIL